MADKNICLQAAEWNLMECLQEASPRTEFEAAQLQGRTVWSVDNEALKVEKDGEGNAYISTLVPLNGNVWLKVANFLVSSLFITARTADSSG